MYVIAFRFESGTLGVAGQKDGSFAMLIVDGKPGDQVVAKDVFGFKTVEEAESYIDEMKRNPQGAKLLEAFEGRYSVVPAQEIRLQ